MTPEIEELSIDSTYPVRGVDGVVYNKPSKLHPLTVSTLLACLTEMKEIGYGDVLIRINGGKSEDKDLVAYTVGRPSKPGVAQPICTLFSHQKE